MEEEEEVGKGEEKEGEREEDQTRGEEGTGSNSCLLSPFCQRTRNTQPGRGGERKVREPQPPQQHPPPLSPAQHGQNSPVGPETRLAPSVDSGFLLLGGRRKGKRASEARGRLSPLGDPPAQLPAGVGERLAWPYLPGLRVEKI